MRRRALMGKKEIPNYGGIPIGIDNVYLYRYYNNEPIPNDDNFATLWVDATRGNTITYGYTITAIRGIIGAMQTLYPTDYWDMLRTRTVAGGEQARFTVLKAYASYFYAIDNATGEYIIKGNAVT